MNKKIIGQGLLHALGVSLYIFIVAFVMRNAERIFGPMPDSFLAPVAFLSLFVVSAAVTASLVGLRPALWYLEGKKREALQLLFATIIWFAVITALVFVGLIVKF